jgi:glycine cleavage system H protein
VQIDYCEFPDDALYDLENNVWIRLDEKRNAKLGITSVQASLAGKLNQVKFKSIGSSLQRGQSVARTSPLSSRGILNTIALFPVFGSVRV